MIQGDWKMETKSEKPLGIYPHDGNPVKKEISKLLFSKSKTEKDTFSSFHWSKWTLSLSSFNCLEYFVHEEPLVFSMASCGCEFSFPFSTSTCTCSSAETCNFHLSLPLTSFLYHYPLCHLDFIHLSLLDLVNLNLMLHFLMSTLSVDCISRSWCVLNPLNALVY